MSEKKPVHCIGIILDGNRRWAKERGLPQLEGHRQGYETLRSTVRAVTERGIPHLAVYAFSTENWKRADEEVSYLMQMIRDVFVRDARTIIDEGVRLRFPGDRSLLAADIQDAMLKMETDSAANTKLTLWVCLSYGSRAEIAAAARDAARTGEITEESLRQHLWTAGMPDPDIIIRTGGQKRLSNFLLWQSAYSELFFLDKMWPDFDEKDLNAVLSEFTARKRNFGI